LGFGSIEDALPESVQSPAKDAEAAQATMASAASIIGSFFMVVFSFGYDFLGVNELTPLRRRHLKWAPHPCIDCPASDRRSQTLSSVVLRHRNDAKSERSD
jgi:hypothetical protein